MATVLSRPQCLKLVAMVDDVWHSTQHYHYDDVIMDTMVSQITIYSAVYFGIDQRKTSKLHVTGLRAGTSPKTGEFPAQKAEKVSIWWRHYDWGMIRMCTKLFDKIVHNNRWCNSIKNFALYGKSIRVDEISIEFDLRWKKALVKWAPAARLASSWSLPHYQLVHVPLQWRHNDHDGVSNHQLNGCSLNRLFRRRSKKTSKLLVTGLCAGNSPGTGEFPAQMASNAENVSIWWRHHAGLALVMAALSVGSRTLCISEHAADNFESLLSIVSSGPRCMLDQHGSMVHTSDVASPPIDRLYVGI